MMRGRLIFPFAARLHRLDARATELSDPGGPGRLTHGYDIDFKESVLVDRDGDGIGERVRVEHPPIDIPCQVEPAVFEALRMFPSGNAPHSAITLIMHFADLERLGLVDDVTGDALVRPGDRLGALLDRRGALVQDIRTPPGLYVSEARIGGFGLGLLRPRRNLLVVSLSDRMLAAMRDAG
jgi:hypothetical protein